MKKFLLGLIGGVVIGAVAATGLFAANEYGLFDKPSHINRAELVDIMHRSEFDSHAEWFVEPSSADSLLVTFRLPMKRRQFLLDKSSVALSETLVARRPLFLRDDKLSLGN